MNDSIRSTYINIAGHPLVNAHNPSPRRADQASALRAGVTLLEVTIVLLIAVAIIAGALYMSASAISQSDSVREVQSLNNLGVAVQRIKTNKGYPASADIVPTLITLGLVPASVQVTGGALVNTWGGTITITQQALGTGFQIAYTNVPISDCQLLVSGVKQGIFNSVGNTGATSNLSTLTATDIQNTCAAGAPAFSTIIF